MHNICVDICGAFTYIYDTGLCIHVYLYTYIAFVQCDRKIMCLHVFMNISISVVALTSRVYPFSIHSTPAQQWVLQRRSKDGSKTRLCTCGVVVLVFRSFAAAKSCHERLQERQPDGAHSFYALFQQVFGRGTFHTDFSWCVDRQDKPTDSARHTRKSRAHLWLPAWWLDWSLVAGLSWHCPHNDVGALYRVFFRGCISPYFTWEFSEGRKSMATQWTHRELAPRYAAGKVPVPWGRECHWETGRLRH